MKTDKQLIMASLQDLALQIIETQIGLKLVQSDREMCELDLDLIKDQEARLRQSIKTLKDKVKWEIQTYGEQVNLQLGLPPQSLDDEGEQWKK